MEEETEDFDMNLNNSAEQMLEKMMNQTFSVNICGRKVKFDIRDEIFQLRSSAIPISRFSLSSLCVIVGVNNQN